jgi:hypothetical protein
MSSYGHFIGTYFQVLFFVLYILSLVVGLVAGGVLFFGGGCVWGGAVCFGWGFLNVVGLITKSILDDQGMK